jgi:hypothetical protein
MVSGNHQISLPKKPRSFEFTVTLFVDYFLWNIFTAISNYLRLISPKSLFNREHMGRSGFWNSSENWPLQNIYMLYW